MINFKLSQLITSKYGNFDIVLDHGEVMWCDVVQGCVVVVVRGESGK